MTRCTTYLTLAACVMAVSAAAAQQPRPAGAMGGSRPPVGSPNQVGGMPVQTPLSQYLTPSAPASSPYSMPPLSNPYSPYSYPGSSYGYGPYDGGGYDDFGGEGGGAGWAASSGGRSARALEVILQASGVPNRNGRVTWPLGFRLLRAGPLQQQLEAQLQLAVEQVKGGGANPQLLDEIRLNVEALRRLVAADKAERFSLPLAVYEDAERFLQMLKRTPQILAASTPGGRAEVTGR